MKIDCQQAACQLHLNQQGPYMSNCKRRITAVSNLRQDFWILAKPGLQQALHTNAWGDSKHNARKLASCLPVQGEAVA